MSHNAVLFFKVINFSSGSFFVSKTSPLRLTKVFFQYFMPNLGSGIWLVGPIPGILFLFDNKLFLFFEPRKSLSKNGSFLTRNKR